MSGKDKREMSGLKDKKRWNILLICNIALIIIMFIGANHYSRFINRNQEKNKREDFVRSVESMKQVSQNYLNSERGYVRNWAHYISDNDMTMEEALTFLRTINTDNNRYAHIVDMDTYDAYSSYYPEGSEYIDTYVKYKELDVEAEEPFGEIMQSMFEGTDDTFSVLGKYRLPETQAMGIGIGIRVTISTDEGKKDYLLLRIMPVDEVKKSWVFPTDYASAEIGVITRAGDYVIQSSSMKSLNFIEYIRTYNFQNDYNKGDELKKQIGSTDNGTLQYKNFRGTDCVWYYSSFGENSALDIVGVISVDDLKVTTDSWYIIILICGVLVFLAAVDGIYLLNINRRLYEEARASEQASQAKTQFLSAMSHDIRTPLNAVMGMMEIARKKPDDSEYVVSCMDKGLKSGNQLMTLINNVLDISKIESGKLSINPEKINIVELLQDLTELIKQSIAKKQIVFKYDYDNIPDRYVLADKMRLNQIYMNLLTNAVKYTQEGGTISLKVYEEVIPDDEQNTRLIFNLQDTGIGMTEKFQKNMYNIFTREVNTQVNTTQGTGLGLSIVKQIVDMMNGTIECNSLPGEGTRFIVTLSLPVVNAAQEDKADNDMIQDISGMHLLVAEDNELNWEIFQEMVSDKGVVCDHAQNGKECVELLSDKPAGTYQAILMDVHMPVMNGYEATRLIRAMDDKDKNKIPIVAMTADAFAEDVRACLDCGMNGHIAKPIGMDRLIGYLVRIKNNRI